MFGPHVDRNVSRDKGRPSITSHIKATRVEANNVDFNAKVFQIFIAGPRSLLITLKLQEEDELKNYLEKNQDIKVIAHGTYADYPWYGSHYQIKFICKELEICDRVGISGLVIHLGKPPIKEVMKYLPRLITTSQNALIYLEVPHVKPQNSHYETPEKLADLFREIKGIDPTLCKFGLCIDTAHLWSCGVNLQSFDNAENWIHRLESVSDIIPPNRIIFHLNDSFDELGSGVDHHAPLLEGKIWEDYKDNPKQSGLAVFVEYAVRNKIPTILERKPKEAILRDYTVLDRLTDTVRI